MFTLLIQNGDGAPKRHELRQGITTVGRNADNQIVLDDGSVSSRHAEIVVGDGKAILCDLNSSNGTTVNGAAVTEVALKVGDEIAFGSVVCRTQAASIKEGQAPSPAFSSATPMDEPASSAPKMEPAQSVSFWSKLLALGKAASKETKRAVQLVGMKAKIEKLKRIDLSNAHFELGKKSYELRLHDDKFAAERVAIAELERRIKEKREGDTAKEHETTGGKIKRMAGNARQSVEAKGLSMKLNRLLTAFGKKIAGSGIAPSQVVSEIAKVKALHETIEKLQGECAANGEPVVTGNRLLAVAGIVVVLFLISVAYNQPFESESKIASIQGNIEPGAAQPTSGPLSKGMLTSEYLATAFKIKAAFDKQVAEVKPFDASAEEKYNQIISAYAAFSAIADRACSDLRNISTENVDMDAVKIVLDFADIASEMSSWCRQVVNFAQIRDQEKENSGEALLEAFVRGALGDEPINVFRDSQTHQERIRRIYETLTARMEHLTEKFNSFDSQWAHTRAILRDRYH